MSQLRPPVTIASAALVASTALALVWAASAHASDGTVPLAPIVASWPDRFAVVGTKSEPLYTERISFARSGDDFTLEIDVLSQGNAALGTQTSAVTVDADSVHWVEGCTKTEALCENDTALRGFLTTALVVAAERAGTLPATGIVRDLHGTDVVCINDADLYAIPSTVALHPCFDIASGAVLGQWSPASHAFVGATLADGFHITTPAPTHP